MHTCSWLFCILFIAGEAATLHHQVLYHTRSAFECSLSPTNRRLILLCLSFMHSTLIDSLCIVPPGRGGSPCRGKGVCIWGSVLHSWTGGGLAEVRIPAAPLRRLEGCGWSRSLPPRTAPPTCRVKQGKTLNYTKQAPFFCLILQRTTYGIEETG